VQPKRLTPEALANINGYLGRNYALKSWPFQLLAHIEALELELKDAYEKGFNAAYDDAGLDD
jgi:hypothetical protein